MNRRHLGEILVRTGLLSQARLDALTANLTHSSASRLAATLVERGEVNDRDLARVIAQELSVPLVSVANADPP
ncbi:MAG: hypothetical protein U0326_43155, partial [Polyangiales bacterium]